MPSNTTNLHLKVDQATESTKFKEWRSDIDSNFTIVDEAYGKINADIAEATTSTTQWASDIANVTDENSKIYTALAGKVTAVAGKSLVDDELIAKLSEDYTKTEVDETFVTKETLANTTIKKEDINLNNYYTKSEVNSIVVGGSSEALKDYYTKEEVDEKLVGDADIQRIIDYLDALNGWELSMKEFDTLNGNGE